MRIWLLYTGEYEDEFVMGAYTSLALAQQQKGIQWHKVRMSTVGEHHDPDQDFWLGTLDMKDQEGRVRGKSSWRIDSIQVDEDLPPE